MIDTWEELAIIAKDAKALDGHDRAVIAQAVLEQQAMEKALIESQREARMLRSITATWPPLVYNPINWNYKAKP